MSALMVRLAALLGCTEGQAWTALLVTVLAFVLLAGTVAGIT